MLGFIFSIIAGATMSVQGVMNTRASEKIGLFGTNLYVQGTAFLLSIVAYFILGDGGLSKFAQIGKPYLLGGVLGLVITITVMLGIKDLSPTLSISVILLSQLLVAAVIDAFGLLGAEKAKFGVMKFIGLGLMIAGVILFKFQALPKK